MVFVRRNNNNNGTPTRGGNVLRLGSTLFKLVLLSIVLIIFHVHNDSSYYSSESSLLDLPDLRDNNKDEIALIPEVTGVSEITTKTNLRTTNNNNDDNKNKNHHCTNDDFHPKNKVGVWTMLNDNMQYVKGAVKLGKSVKAHTSTPIDLIVMELESKPLSDEEWVLLHEVGFMKCSVTSIPPPKPEKTRPDLREKFAVLHVWAMEVYDKIVFLDADTFVQNNGIDPLIHMDLQGKPIGVTKDIRARKWVDTFNSGVMVFQPSLDEHQRLVNLLHDDNFTFEYIMSDQGFLNEVYKNNWYEIGFVNNANLALYRFQRSFWDEHPLNSINVIHYTMQKPWKCKSNGPYGPICDLWIHSS